MNFFDSNAFSKIPKFAVGILYFWQRFFVKIFDPSNWEAALSGPNTLTEEFSKKSTIPSTRGFSGPTISKSILFFSTACLISWKLLISIIKFLEIFSVPPLPGIQKILSTLLDLLKAKQIEFSLPPLPIIPTFMYKYI